MHLVESVNAEPRFVKANYKIIYGFSSAIRISTPKPCVVQGSTIYFKVKSERKQNYQNRKIIDATCSEGGCVGGGGMGGCGYGCVLVTQSCLTLCDPWTNPPGPRLLCPWNFLGKNTGVSCHYLLQREMFEEIYIPKC